MSKANDLIETRKTEFKKGVGERDGVNQRNKLNKTARQQKRTEKLRKQRMKPTSATSINIPSTVKLISKLAYFTNQLFLDDPVHIAEGLAGVDMVSHTKDAQLLKILATDRILKRLTAIGGSTDKKCIEYAYLALDILSRFASNPEVLHRMWTKTDIAQVVMKILKNNDIAHVIRASSVWVVGNIIGSDDNIYRDAFIKNGITEVFVSLLKYTMSLNPIPDLFVPFRNNLLWALSNCYKGYKQPDFTRLTKSGATPLIMKCILESESASILQPCIWSIYHAALYPMNQKVMLGNIKLLERICDLCESKDFDIQCPSIKVLASLTAYPETGGDFSVGNIITESKALRVIRLTLDSPSSALKAEATFAVSNLAAGLPVHLEKLIKDGILDIIIENAFQCKAIVKHESIRTLSNSFRTAADIHGKYERETVIDTLIDKRALEAVASGITIMNPEIQLDVISCCRVLVATMRNDIIPTLDNLDIIGEIATLATNGFHTQVNTRASEFIEFIDSIDVSNKMDISNDEYDQSLFVSGDNFNFNNNDDNNNTFDYTNGW